ncbi:MAG TPA: hypothetical protein OIM61_02465 [Clostridiaceae bacterium]|jgi:hypothetical protein|nr:putative uncharacterized protein [Clostridium sp. CAG:343]HCF35109.1 hypothetical protein [Clostridiales bacterium]HJJ18128.1 hypothetical protein [Clostridiaceae bacterium]
MELNPDNRTEMIKSRVSEEEKILIKAKAEYYGYKQLSKYIRDSAIYEKVTNVDLIGKNEILKAYSDNTQILKEMHKSIKHIAIFAKQIDKYEREDLKFKMLEILKNQKEMIKLIDKKLDLDVWQEVNHRKKCE